jgi:hypothetical protein
MTKTATIVVTAMLLGNAACDTGDSTVPPNQNEPLCTATLALSGTLVTSNGQPPPTDQGCVPAGTWKVNVAVADKGTCTATVFKPTYEYVVITVPNSPRDTKINYTPAAGEEVNKSLAAGGNGQCEGSFEHVSAGTGGQYNLVSLHPYFDKGTLVIKGSGSYELWPSKP